MPELYGNPFKSELRREIQELKTALWNERKEHRNTRNSLRWARCKIEALESKLQRTQQKGQELLAEVTQDVEEATNERYVNSFSFRRSA
jgi:predicted  nucleic acid-binding Zn-ribbon protein